MKTLGIDVGSSSVKVSLMEIESGICLSSQTFPKAEMPIDAKRKGWAEQDPDMWWEYACMGIKEIAKEISFDDLKAIGITYQMHGLVVVDKNGKPLRKAIIWCDSRAVEIGAEALEAIGHDFCLEHALNSPGNFTASKLAWVKKNEPELFAKIDKIMLPGDYIAYKLSDEIATTSGGLSEGIMWDFKEDKRADFVLDNYGIPKSMLPENLQAIGIQCRTSKQIAETLGIPEGTPISYRAGDQPNNAFSLNVLSVGEIAATAGTSGVVYGVTDIPKADKDSRVNTFLHVNHTADEHRYGVLLCINGTGILNAWTKRLAGEALSYNEINDLCETVPAGSDGLIMLPFGNGAERMLCNRFTGAMISEIDLNRHTKAHVMRAAQEGIAFAFRYGIEIMKELGVGSSVIRAGKANLFLSPVFRTTLATLCDAKIELYNTDGALGAARGAALGAGYYKDNEEAFASLKQVGTTLPDPSIKQALEEAYADWKHELESKLNA